MFAISVIIFIIIARIIRNQIEEQNFKSASECILILRITIFRGQDGRKEYDSYLSQSFSQIVGVHHDGDKRSGFAGERDGKELLKP